MILEISEKIKNIYKSPEEDNTYIIKPFVGLIKEKNWRHHFLTFLKPEILSLQQGINVESTLNFIFDHYEKWGVHIEGIRILSGTHLREHQIISKNYETLHKISYAGLNACSEKVKFKINELCKLYNVSKENIFGGHEFLKINPEISSEFLNKTISFLENHKLGSGVYAVNIEHKNTPYIVLNGFHPFQVNSLTKPGDAIIALECFSNDPWTVLRHDFVGTVYPEQSKKGSFRRELFEKKQILNIKTVDISHNGLHISPGPIEAAFQLINFFVEETKSSDFFSQMNFFEKINTTLSREIISLLKTNPHVKKEGEPHKSPLFECTEDMNSEEAEKFLEKQYTDFIS